MRYDNIKQQPVRLSLTRCGPHCYAISRAGTHLGFVGRREGAWYVSKGASSAENFQQTIRLGYSASRPAPTFKTAVLHVARHENWVSSGDFQVYENVTCVRVCVTGHWFTFAYSKRESLWVFDDFPAYMLEPTDHFQALLRKGHAVAVKALQAHQDEL